jgi:hypothetical protein
MSWLTKETICMDCAAREDELKARLRPEESDRLEAVAIFPKAVMSNME